MSIFCRKSKPFCVEENVSSLNSLQNGEFILNSETGEYEFVAKEPVAPSLAADFDVLNNSLLRGRSQSSPMRVNTDPVDLPNLFD